MNTFQFTKILIIFVFNTIVILCTYIQVLNYCENNIFDGCLEMSLDSTWFLMDILKGFIKKIR